MFGDVADEFCCLLAVVDGDHKHAGFLDAGGVQQVRPGRVPEEHLDAERANHFELLGLMVEHNRFVAGRQQDTVHDAAKAAVTGDDDAAALVDLVGFACLRTGVARRYQLVVHDEEQRRQQHRQRDNEQQLVGQAPRDDAVRNVNDRSTKPNSPA